MGTPLQLLPVLGLVAANIVIGFVLVKWLMGLVAELTKDEPYLGCVGLPVALLVALSSLLVWFVATS